MFLFEYEGTGTRFAIDCSSVLKISENEKSKKKRKCIVKIGNKMQITCPKWKVVLKKTILVKWLHKNNWYVLKKDSLCSTTAMKLMIK